ncbi:hypothetical protein LguiA_017730 [Lonicera macranthoides]
MQRWCSKLRSLAVALHSSATTTTRSSSQLLSLSSPRFIHSSPSHLLPQIPLIPSSSNFIKPLFSSPSTPQILFCNHHASLLPLSSLIQVRHLTLKQRKRKLKIRRPPTPVVSKLKKTKMKYYSSYKDRFRPMKDGQIRRWKEGRRHNAHLKSNKAKRRLRLPGIVPLAYAKVMKKLNFCG